MSGSGARARGAAARCRGGRRANAPPRAGDVQKKPAREPFVGNRTNGVALQGKAGVPAQCRIPSTSVDKPTFACDFP